MHEPVRIEVVWDDSDIEIRLMKGLVALVEKAQLPSAGAHIDPAALDRVGKWFSARCASEVEATLD